LTGTAPVRASDENPLIPGTGGVVAYGPDGAKIRRVTPQGAVTTIADISNVQGAQPGFALSPHESARGLAWRDGALYATVVNAVVKISF
jgi:hypothetical protein